MSENDRNGMAKALQAMTDKWKAAELKIKELEQEIAQTKAAKTELERITIPDFMLEHQTNSFGLLSGQVVTVKPFYEARLLKSDGSEGSREPFFQWLREHNHGGIIKDSFEVFPSTPEKAAYLELFLSHEIGPMYDRKVNIHWKTLEAWFKEQVENRAPIPGESGQLFNYYVGRKATIK